MSNQLETKRLTLAKMLAANRLTKVASDQDIEHKEDPTEQKNLGKEQTGEIKDLEGTNAATQAAANKSSDSVDTPPNCQDLNKPAQAALASTGTSVKAIHQCGAPAEMPKSAADYRSRLAGILNKLNKKASAESARVKTGTEVLKKFASLNSNSTAQDIEEAKSELVKLASSNPLFTVCRDQILMRKLAEDVDALAKAEGISPEEAADALDAAAAENPEMIEEATDEANGEAVADLAGAEEQTAALMDGAQQLADNASAVLGQEVTPDQILNAIDEVEAQAAELGVPPEALVQAAMEEIQGAGETPEVTPEDEANAQAILDEAAANGVSPEEVIQMAAEELGGQGSEEAAPAQADMPKEASFKPTRARTTRAAYVQHLMHSK